MTAVRSATPAAGHAGNGLPAFADDSAAPFEPPAVSREDVRLRNELVGRHRPAPLAIGGETHVLRFQHAPLAVPSGPAVRLVGGPHVAVVRLADWQGFAAVHELAGGALDDVPAEVQAIVLDAAFGPLLHVFDGLTGVNWEIAEVARQADAAPGEVELWFTLESAGGARRNGRLAVRPDLAAQLANLAQKVRASAWQSLDELPVAAPLELGSTGLPPADLRGLRRHDVVLIEAFAAPAADGVPRADVLLARFGPGCAFAAVVKEGQAVLGQPVATAPEAKSAGPPRLVFERGRAATTLGRLRSAKPGATLPLAPPADGRVRLTLAGRPLGSGEVVHVGDRLGVRVLDFTAP